MGAEELLDEDAFDPKKLFNEEEYSTLIIGREGFNKAENHAADLIEGLLDTKLSRPEREELFLQLKKAKAQQLMVDALNAAQKVSEKTIIAAACWECGLDFTPFFLDFVKLTTHQNFQLALEALSVIENSEGTLDEKTLTQALEIAQSANLANEDLLRELIENIKSRIA